MDTSSSSSSSSSSDEEIFEIVENVERPRVFRKRSNPFEMYNNNEFRQRFRLTKETVTIIVNLLEDDIQPMTNRNQSLSAMDQILITLRFYATGSFHIMIGVDYGIHKTTVSRVVQKISNHLAALRPHFIKMPEEVEKPQVKQGFFNIRGFPNVIGCVDGSHIPILSPGGENAELFRNRKGYFSINIQNVCDSKLLIRDLDARWPGSTHDSTMWNASLLGARCEAGEFPNCFILGDSAYACREFMMTPLLNPVTAAEHNYNAAHIQTRNCVERCFGVWKRRFACLSNGLRTKLETSLSIIIATAVLHNIAILENDVEEFDEDDLPYENVDQDINNDPHGRGNAVRRALIDTVFRLYNIFFCIRSLK